MAEVDDQLARGWAALAAREGRVMFLGGYYFDGDPDEVVTAIVRLPVPS